MTTAHTCPSCGVRVANPARGGHCPACLLRIGLALLADGPVDSPIPPTPTLSKPRLFGDYELLSVLATGGMGVVYRARQRSLDREVAVKMIRAGELANEAEIARFRREAEAAAHLDHPNIVPIHEVGEWEGQHYFSMKLVSGGSLAVSIARGDLLDAPRVAVSLMIRVARAVHFAHQRGILHRDLKPGNILLDENGQPWVSDFGLAGRVNADSLLTLVGSVMGTPAYMAPEQAAGVSPSTTAVDVYSLGAILYEVLTGEPPFRGSDILDTLMRVREQAPVPPRRRRPGVPRDLEIICLKCLEKDPQHRYPSAEAVAEDLERWLGYRPIQARPSGPWLLVAKWTKRRPALAAAVVCLHLVAGLGLGGIFWQWRAAVSARLAAEQALTEREKQVWLASINQAWAERLTEASGARTRALAAVRRAAQIRPSSELRDEAIAALSLRDFGEPVLQTTPAGAHGWVAFDSSGRRTAVAVAGGGIVLSTGDGAGDRSTLPSQGSLVVGHGFSPDGTLLAADQADGRVVLWDLARREVRWNRQVNSQSGGGNLAFHPIHPWLAVRTMTNRLEVLRLEDGGVAEILELPGRPDVFRYSPTGRRLALTQENECRVWDTAAHATEWTLTHRCILTALAWHRDESLVFLGTEMGEVIAWNLDTGQQEIRLEELQFVASLDVHSNEGLLVSGHWNNISQLWDAMTLDRLALHRGSVAIGFLGDSGWVSGQWGGARHGRWPMVRPEHLRRLDWAASGPYAKDVAWSPDGRILATIHHDGLRLWNPQDARLIQVVRTNECGFLLAFAQDGSALLTCADNLFWRWPLVSSNRDSLPVAGAPVPLLESGMQPLDSSEGVQGLGHLFPTDSRIHRRENRLRLADLSDPGRLLEVPDFPGGVYTLSRTTNWIGLYHPSGAQIRPIGGGDPIVITTGPGGLLWLSPDSRRLVRLGSGEVSAHATDTGRLVWRWLGETAATMSPAFSPDGSLLALAGSASSAVVLLNPENGVQVATLTPPDHTQVAALAFSPDGLRLAVVQAKQIHVWSLPLLRRQLAELALDW